MSLINRMLQDLDARGVDQPLPSDVRPLPPAPRSRRPMILAAVVVLALAVALTVWQLGLLQPPEPPAPVAIVAGAVEPVPPAPPAAVEQRVELRPEAPLPEAPPVEIKRPVPNQRATPVVTVPPEKKPAVKTVKAPDADAEVKPAHLSPPAKPSVKSPEAAPPAQGKAAKEPTIARSDSAASPRSRAESEYRQAIEAVNQGRIAEAVDGLTRALHGDALHTGARQLLVKLLLEAKRVDEALQVLHEGLQGQPAQLGWAMTLARLQVDRSDLAGAWQTLEFSLPAAGHHADYLGFAAHVLQRLGRHREAIAQYQAAARLAPGDGRWWLGLGLAMESEGRVSESREAFLRAKQCGNLGSALSALVEQKLR